MNKQKNKYYYRSHLSNAKFRQLLKCFAIALNAFEAHKITNISHRSCKIIYVELRIYILTNHLGLSADTGVFELDESYFGAKRVRGKRGRGAAGKTPVFGLPKRDGKVKEMAKYMLRYLKTVPVPA